MPKVVDAQDEEDEEEHVLEANAASDDELEAEYQEAVALMTIAKQRRAEVDRARQFFRKPQSSEDRKAKLDNLKQKLPCARCGQLGHWKDDNDYPAKVKVVNWEETEEQVTEEPHPSRVTTFLSHGRERCATTSGEIDTACARTLAETRWCEKFEVELKRHATPVEVVPDNETFRFGPGAVKKSSRAVIFPVAVGQNVFLLRARLLTEEVPLLISMGVVQQLGSVIDVAEKTIEFRNFKNAQVPLEVVAGHLTMDLKPKHASALQKQLTPQMWEQARQGQEAIILRPSSEKLVWTYHRSHIVSP